MLHQQDFFFFTFLCSLYMFWRPLACLSSWNMHSSLNGHLSEKVTPDSSSSRSHFQHACGRWLTIRSLLSVSLSVSRVGRGPRYKPPCNIYYCLFAVFMSSYRHELYVLRLYVLLYNLGITQWYCMKQQASANICLFAFRWTQRSFSAPPFSPKCAAVEDTDWSQWLLNVCWMWPSCLLLVWSSLPREKKASQFQPLNIWGWPCSFEKLIFTAPTCTR